MMLLASSSAFKSSSMYAVQLIRLYLLSINKYEVQLSESIQQINICEFQIYLNLEEILQNLQVQFIFMHKKNHSINEGSVSTFLSKFQGKINILSKFGEINHGDVVHLPIIKTDQSKKSSMFNLSNLSTKKSFSSVCSNIRRSQNKTTFTLKRHDFNLEQQKKGIKSEIRNRILKPLEPIQINRKNIQTKEYESFSATPPLRKHYTLIDNLDRIDKKDAISKHIENSFKQKRQKTDYSNFLRQLDIISNQGVRKSQKLQIR